MQMYVEPTVLAEIAKSILNAAKCTPIPDIGNFFAGNVRFLKFSRSDVLKMPKRFRKQFLASGSTAYIRLDVADGCRFFTVRYKNNGYSIEFIANSVKEAKTKFIDKVNELCLIEEKELNGGLLCEKYGIAM